MLRTVIIDDEAHIRDTLTRLLESYCPQVSVVGEASGVADGISAIKDLYPDLILLDINMKDGTGFDLLKTFSTMDFKVIFVSALDKRTVKAFNHIKLPYLQKPVSPVELCEAVRDAEQLKSLDLKKVLDALDPDVII